jgi:hypothetical protein
VDKLEREIEKAVFVRAEAPTLVKGENPLERYEIIPGTIAEFERRPAYKRSQVVECSLERSVGSAESGVVGWVDGFLITMEDGKSGGRTAGQRARVKLQDVHRSYAEGAPV